MKTQVFIIGAILGILLVAGCAKQQIIGGDKDEHGCLIAAGYSWNATVGACVREWELNEAQREGAKFAVAPLSYPVTITNVEVLRCPGCFIVHLQRNDNQEQFEVKIINWTISQETVACTEEAKICPDGSSVGRNSSNNCEFDPCPSGTGGTQIANPASVYCEENGGTLKMVETDEGTQGVCVLKNGAECDEWAYFRGECPINLTYQASALPHLIIYKTRQDYYSNVPVHSIITVNNKKMVNGYPGVKDIIAQNETASWFRYPTRLSDGFFLDNKGIGVGSAFLSITYEQYASFKNDSNIPAPDKLYEMVLDANPFIEMYECGVRHQSWLNEEGIREINSTIENGQIQNLCKKLI